MKSPNEITQILAAAGWSNYRLSQVTNEPEAAIKKAVRDENERDVRVKIAEAVGSSYEDLFGN